MVFVNTKKMSERRWYRNVFQGPAHYQMINMMTGDDCDDDKIICPCIIESVIDLTQLESFINIKLERLTFRIDMRPCDNRFYLYYATRRELMTKAAVKASKPKG